MAGDPILDPFQTANLAPYIDVLNKHAANLAATRHPQEHPMTSPTQRRHDEIIGRLDAIIDAATPPRLVIPSSSLQWDADSMRRAMEQAQIAVTLPNPEPVDVTVEPPVGSQVTDEDGDIWERRESGWAVWYIDLADWDSGETVWGDVVQQGRTLRLTTDADRERVGLPVDTAPDVDPDDTEAYLTGKRDPDQAEQLAAKVLDLEDDVERLTRKRDEAREVAKSHVEDARDWRRRHAALRADVDEFQHKHRAYAGTWELNDALARDDQRGRDA